MNYIQKQLLPTYITEYILYTHTDKSILDIIQHRSFFQPVQASNQVDNIITNSIKMEEHPDVPEQPMNEAKEEEPRHQPRT